MKRALQTSTVIAVLAAALAFSLPALAQWEPPSVDERIEELDKVVNLTDEQEKKIREIYEEEIAEQEKAASERRSSRRRGRDGDSQRPARNERPEGGRPQGPGRGGRGAFMALREILSEEQMAKYRDHLRAQSIERRLGMYKEQLELTDKQADKVKDILVDESKETEKFMEKVRDLPQEERREAFGQMREMREKTNDKIKKVLKGEQKEKFDKMMEEMRNRRGNRGNS